MCHGDDEQGRIEPDPCVVACKWRTECEHQVNVRLVESSIYRDSSPANMCICMCEQFVFLLVFATSPANMCVYVCEQFVFFVVVFCLPCEHAVCGQFMFFVVVLFASGELCDSIRGPLCLVEW